jgi:hypothetical protein
MSFRGSNLDSDTTKRFAMGLSLETNRNEKFPTVCAKTACKKANFQKVKLCHLDNTNFSMIHINVYLQWDLC